MSRLKCGVALLSLAHRDRRRRARAPGIIRPSRHADRCRRQISAEGGVEPKWRRDGRELYFLALDGKLMAVSIGAPAFQPGRPVAMFQTPLPVSRTLPVRDRRYDVGPDGRFLMVVPAASGAAAPTTVVVNWPAGLEK